MTRRIKIALFLSLVLLAQASSSFACPVCFGDSDAPIVRGVELSVLFMMGVTYFVIFGGLTAFFLIRRHARRMAEQQPEFE